MKCTDIIHSLIFMGGGISGHASLHHAKLIIKILLNGFYVLIYYVLNIRFCVVDYIEV